MNRELVHRFDVHVAGPDSLEGAQDRLRMLVAPTAVSRFRSGAGARRHRRYTGTSVAAAHVAGAAALLKLLKGWEADQLKRYLVDSADPTRR